MLKVGVDELDVLFRNIFVFEFNVDSLHVLFACFTLFEVGFMNGNEPLEDVEGIELKKLWPLDRSVHLDAVTLELTEFCHRIEGSLVVFFHVVVFFLAEKIRIDVKLVY